MKERTLLHTNVVYILLLAALGVVVSCSVQKRLYTKGFYMARNRSACTISDKAGANGKCQHENLPKYFFPLATRLQNSCEKNVSVQETGSLKKDETCTRSFSKQKIRPRSFQRKKTQAVVLPVSFVEEIDFEKERRMKGDAHSGLFFSCLSWLAGFVGFVAMLFGGRGLLLVGLGIIFAILGLVFSVSSLKLNAKFPLRNSAPLAAIVGLIMSILFFALFLGITYLSLGGILF